MRYLFVLHFDGVPDIQETLQIYPARAVSRLYVRRPLQDNHSL